MDKQKLNNVLGAFADTAILFPLIALLTVRSGFSGPMILFTTGAAYLFAAYFFKVPMSVQPLKSIAIAAVSVGASFSEVRVSGLLLGLVCLGLLKLDVERWTKKVPSSVIHQLQLGLGILLVFQGLKGGLDLVIVAACLALYFVPKLSEIPLLGLLATVGMLIAVFKAEPVSPDAVTHSLFQLDSKFRFGMILSLLLPQIALTMTNSVIATKDVSERAFGEEAKNVTIRNLLKSIGIGNVFTSIVGGMPFCHGSGGITAHVRGGSTKAWSTGLMGVVLVMLALIQWIKGSTVLEMPSQIVGILLITIGIVHMKLAKPTLQENHGRAKLITASVLTIFSRNLLVVLIGAFIMEYYFQYQDSEEQPDDSVS
jgi:MFS superfamily sulfate permease-like transporter